jgi:D-glycero-alpha-D-manno-heptose-7-phosphate kinase
VLTRRAIDQRRDEIAFRLLETALAATGVRDGVRLRVETDVVPGAGLGGSASAAVAALAALRASLRESPTAEELAVQAIRLERDGLRLVCGSQDQIFAAVGGVLDLRFDEVGLRGCDPIFPDPALLRRIEAGLMLVDTGRRRVSGEVLGRARRGADTTAELVAAAGEVAEGLAAGSLERVLAGMRRNAAAKVRRDPVASAPAVELAAQLEPLGAEVVRMCGAGLGGHALVWAPEDRHPAIAAALDGCTIRRPLLRAPGIRLEE